jgi:hypothetical protein
MPRKRSGALALRDAGRSGAVLRGSVVCCPSLSPPCGERASVRGDSVFTIGIP